MAEPANDPRPPADDPRPPADDPTSSVDTPAVAERPDDTPKSPAPQAVGSWRRRAAALALVAGAVVALGSLAPSWPHERTVELRVPRPASVQRIAVVWSRASEPEPVVVKSSAWAFDETSAPSSIVTSVDLAEGTYEVDIQVERADGATAARRVVTVGDADRIALPLP